MLITSSVLLGLVFYQHISKILTDSGMVLPIKLYLFLEVVYVITAFMMLWHSRLIQQFIKEFALRVDPSVPILLKPANFVRHMSWAIFHIGHIAKKAPKQSKSMLIWFGVNRGVALIQPTLTAYYVFRYSELHWSLELSVQCILFLDLVSTLVIASGVHRRLQLHETQVRKVRADDLQGIMAVDQAAYQGSGPESLATSSMMAARIRNGADWFWVAEKNNEIIAILSLMPTTTPPTQFTSWEQCTDDGTLNSLDETGTFVYGVALSAKPGAGNAVDILLAESAGQTIYRNKRMLYLCGRIPRYHRYSNKMSAEEYFAATRKDNTALDPQIQMYESLGFDKIRLVHNAFTGDLESMGFGVLFTKTNPYFNKPYRKIIANFVRLLARNPVLFERLLK
jgi:hypothetical protein